MKEQVKKKTSKRKWLAACIAGVAAVVLLAAVVLSWYMPEKPLDLSFAQEQGATWQRPGAATGVTIEDTDDYREVARNDRYRLELHTGETMFRVVDNRTGSVWYGGHQPDGPMENVIPRNARTMKNLLSVSYVDEENNVSFLNSSAKGVTTTYATIDGGLEMLFDYEEAAIQAVLQIYLDETGFYACVPGDRIRENGDYRVISMDILPAFGSVMSGTDSYMLYPDGSGVLFDCKNATGNELLYSDYVYAAPAVSLEAEETGKKNIPLPYYGSTGQEGGHAAYVVSGAEYARITLSPGSSTFGLNQIYSSLEYRHTLTVLNSRDEEMDVISPQRADVDFCVKYLLLERADATYSGMATALRGYLQKIGILPQQAVVPDKMPLALDILMGVQQENLLGTSYRHMTTGSQAETMLLSLRDKGVEALYTTLLGWQKEGYGAGPLSANSAGGSLSDLLAAVRDTDKLFLQTDYRNAYADGSFSMQRDVVYNFFDQAVTDRQESQFLLNPYKQYQKLYTDLEKYRKLGACGLAFDSLSGWLPADSSKNRSLTATDSKNIYAAMLALTKEQQLSTAVQIGNDYLLPKADYLYDVHEGGSRLFGFSREVPVYSMILHGLIPYACATPGNMSSDFTRTKLKWVEYGSMPYFLVTNESASALEKSDVSDIFSSRFSDWETVIADTYREFTQRLSGVYARRMVSHEYLRTDVVCVTYDTGECVVVNYSDQDIDVDGVTVPATDYAVLRGE